MNTTLEKVAEYLARMEDHAPTPGVPPSHAESNDPVPDDDWASESSDDDESDDSDAESSPGTGLSEQAPATATGCRTPTPSQMKQEPADSQTDEGVPLDEDVDPAVDEDDAPVEYGDGGHHRYVNYGGDLVATPEAFASPGSNGNGGAGLTGTWNPSINEILSNLENGTNDDSILTIDNNNAYTGYYPTGNGVESNNGGNYYDNNAIVATPIAAPMSQQSSYLADSHHSAITAKEQQLRLAEATMQQNQQHLTAGYQSLVETMQTTLKSTSRHLGSTVDAQAREIVVLKGENATLRTRNDELEHEKRVLETERRTLLGLLADERKRRRGDSNSNDNDYGRYHQSHYRGVSQAGSDGHYHSDRDRRLYSPYPPSRRSGNQASSRRSDYDSPNHR